MRQAAVEYCCRYMNEEEVCEKLLSGLYGKLFYWSVVQLADSQEERLKTVLDNYAEYYTGQEILRDACFVKLQDREAVKRIYRYLARMRRAPAILENPDPVFVIGDIRRVELLEELGKFLDLMIRDKFRDRKWNGLQVSLVSALTRIASNNQQEKDMVQNLLEEKLDYCWRQWWKARCLDLQNQKEAYITKEEPAPHMTQQNDGVSEIMWGLNKKFIACICLAEDVRWRIARKTDLVHGKE